eukprot:gene18027-25266_t
MASAAQWFAGGSMGLVVALWFEPLSALGQVIQRACERALTFGVSTRDVLGYAQEFHRGLGVYCQHEIAGGQQLGGRDEGYTNAVLPLLQLDLDSVLLKHRRKAAAQFQHQGRKAAAQVVVAISRQWRGASLLAGE